MAPYCAIPRDYLSDTPLLRAMGFLVSQHGQLGAVPPPPFLSVSPFESMRSGGAIPSLKRGISAILARYPMKTRQTGAIPPSAILSRNGIARYGGVSRTGPLSNCQNLILAASHFWGHFLVVVPAKFKPKKADSRAGLRRRGRCVSDFGCFLLESKENSQKSVILTKLPWVFRDLSLYFKGN